MGTAAEQLAQLRELGLELEATGRPDDPALQVVRGSPEYLEKRKEQIRYAQFQGMGYPIPGRPGTSGAVVLPLEGVVEAGV